VKKYVLAILAMPAVMGILVLAASVLLLLDKAAWYVLLAIAWLGPLIMIAMLVVCLPHEVRHWRDSRRYRAGRREDER
jgi:hypothetical protein